ncbi:hypothetical protein ALP29_200490 [Pseudomonas syringae pv. avii]|uniref:Uncharacterized protein n=1 Tax=Pseudomonas syringae pv. avii TaxID=663959 RepID=A0A3M5W2Q8_PSESX|nr:hypothetical protein ALP29_200490 [Pseudomonas syringae pv. avii]
MQITHHTGLVQAQFYTQCRDLFRDRELPKSLLCRVTRQYRRNGEYYDGNDQQRHDRRAQALYDQPECVAIHLHPPARFSVAFTRPARPAR